MGYLKEIRPGYYILKARLGALSINWALMDADKPMEELLKGDTKTSGFFLDIPDRFVSETDKEED